MCEKKYKLKHIDQKSRERIVEGTLQELIKYYSYVLEIGFSYDKKIKLKPTTIQSFMSNLKKAYGMKEGCCYGRTFIELLG